MIVLISTLVIGVTLWSYLALVSNQNQSVMRSMAWNSAIAVAEAGIEEAMAHLNENGTNRLASGWTLSGTNVVKERFLGADKYKVAVSISEPPIITSHAHVVNPAKNQFLERPRVIRAGTRINAVFSKAMVAKGAIDMMGNNVRTDSFDSTDPAYSNNGRYDSSEFKDGGDIATNSDVINVGNADIFGRASTGPGGAVNVGSNGKVGSKAWHANSNNHGAQPGWVSDDMNIEIPDVELPPGLSSAFPPLIPGVLPSGQFKVSSISMSGNEKLRVTGNAVLLVTGNVSLSGNARIEIDAGASLQIYVQGSSASLNGNGVANANTSASSFGYWGLNSNTSVSFGGNAAFTGTIYAPYAALSMGGGGNNTYDFVGASVSNSVRMNGHFNFHYDEALGKFGPRRGYTIISWNEVAWTEL